MTDSLLREFHKKGVYKLGDFVLKSGMHSPIYIDFRVLISTPQLLKETSNQLADVITDKKLVYDYIVGVPYGALPIATFISGALDSPMLMKRKEAKSYGTKKLIEGIYEPNKTALIIEDVVTSGGSILETVEVLRGEGLICTDVVCVLNREQGGAERLAQHGITLHSLASLSTILDFLESTSVISTEKKSEIAAALAANVPVIAPRQSWDLESRLPILRKNVFNNRLLDVILAKKTNLCVAIDELSKARILTLLEEVGDYVCAIKLHIDIIDNINDQFMAQIMHVANDQNFLIFVDRKFADTGNTVGLQLGQGVFHLSTWADVVTVHAIPGPSILTAVGNVIKEDKKLAGALLIASLSSAGALTDEKYAERAVAMAQNARDVVSGFICQKRPSDDPAFLYWSPGVNESAKTDGKGQQWRSIEDAIVRDGNDIIVVGRAITSVLSPDAEAKAYATKAYELWTARTASDS